LGSGIACVRQRAVTSKRMKLRLRKWVFWWSVLGLLVPGVLILRWKIFGSVFGQMEAILWPSSIVLIGLEGQVSIFVILLGYAIAIVANVVVYSGIGLLSWPAVRIMLRRSVSSK
jgi:hypothetical protein